jgi:hypothetical protein
MANGRVTVFYMILAARRLGILSFDERMAIVRAMNTSLNYVDFETFRIK